MTLHAHTYISLPQKKKERLKNIFLHQTYAKTYLHAKNLLVFFFFIISFILAVFCRHVGQSCGAKHFRASSAGSEYRPLAQTEEA